jgi:inner membrane protein YidH
LKTAPSPAEERKQDRDALALDRTVLANERTYQAWLRTGLASAAAGLGVAKFLQETIPLWILLVIATVLILFSAVAFWLAAWRYSHVHLRTAHLDIETIRPWMAKSISLVLAACSLLALGGLLVTALG